LIDFVDSRTLAPFALAPSFLNFKNGSIFCEKFRFWVVAPFDFDILRKAALQLCEVGSLLAMKSTANRLVLIVGAFILALMALDGLIQLNRSAQADFGVGVGTGPWVEANGAAALFLVGLVSGVVLGIGLFFASLMWRERRLLEEDADDLEALMAEIETLEGEEEQGFNPLFAEDAPTEDFAETRDPWEKPADWWKSGDED